jgi:[acyl-carrier-protein] S-malonyltransferase
VQSSVATHRHTSQVTGKFMQDRSLIFMFPGQSSVYPEMLERALTAWPWADTVIRRASDVLGWDLKRHYQSSNPAIFLRNQDVQLGGFLTSHLHLMALTRAGVEANRSLGLSLGEYNHLVHIGALDFEDALTLIAARGQAYDAGPPGKMASVFPIDARELEPLLEEAPARGIVEIAGFNSPGQQVIAGDHLAVDAVLERLDDEAGVSAVVIEHRIPMHTSRFQCVARTFRSALESAPWKLPHGLYLPNATAVPEAASSPRRFADLLSRHVYQPVLWRASIEQVWAELPGAVFLEVGPRGVLSNLLSRRWIPCVREKTDGPDGIESLVERLAVAA